MSKKIVFNFGNISILNHNFNAAFEALKEVLIDEHSKRTGNENRLLWINIQKVKDSTNLEDLLMTCQWFPEYDLNDNIDTLKSRIELLGEDKLVFNALAPYIENGSSLIMYAEDEYVDYKEHRYIFENGVCIPKVSFGNELLDVINFDSSKESKSLKVDFRESLIDLSSYKPTHDFDENKLKDTLIKMWDHIEYNYDKTISKVDIIGCDAKFHMNYELDDSQIERLQDQFSLINEVESYSSYTRIALDI